MKLFFGFALAASMFEGNGAITFEQISPEEAKDLLLIHGLEYGRDTLYSCINPSHVPTIEAARVRYGINVEVPEKAPKVTLEVGDQLLVMGVQGLPRLSESRHEYTSEEIESASFKFTLFTREN